MRSRGSPGSATGGQRVPTRTCIGCGKKAPKAELRRLVIGPGGQPELDPEKSGRGRGAYLCGAGCLKSALKRRAFGRAFRGKAAEVNLERLEVALRES